MNNLPGGANIPPGQVREVIVSRKLAPEVKEARAKAKAEEKALAKEQELMTDVENLSPGDTFTLDEVGYVVLSIDNPANHIHTNLLEEEETPGTHGSVDFGIMVDIIAKAKTKEKKGKEAVVSAPTSAKPAVTGGRWFK